jgi:parallel beta-helix repeat protein
MASRLLRLPRLPHRLAGGLAVAAIAIAASAAPARADVVCTRALSPGADVQSAVNSGGVTCLHGGTYTRDVKITASGATLTSYPGERATLVGRLWVATNLVTVSDLNLDGKNSAGLPSPTITSNDSKFLNNDVSDEHTEICFDVGNDVWGTAARTLIQGNRIHACGALPATNYDHGIYVSNATDTQILDNVIYDNADRGVQLYPDAQRTTVSRNIIDGNGEGVLFAGDSSTASSNNTVSNNVITYSKLRYNVESYWGGATGTGNVATNNCVYGGAQGNIGSQSGFSAVNNLVQDPQYRDRANGDYTIPATNPCAALLGGAPLSSVSTSTTTSTTTTSTTTTTPSTAPTPTPSTKPGQRKGQVRATTALNRLSVSVRRSGGRLLVSGRVGRQFASRTLRVRVDLRGGTGWRTAGSRTLRHQTAFHATVALAHAAAAGGRLGVRVRVGSVGQRVVWLRA